MPMHRQCIIKLIKQSETRFSDLSILYNVFLVHVERKKIEMKIVLSIYCIQLVLVRYR